MTIVQFNEMRTLPNSEISEAIIQTEKELFNLQFKKATRQPFKPHEIKSAKRRLAQLKTLLTMRLDALEKKRSNTVTQLLKKQNYMTGNF
uniref:Large ribosomal subunit protein uL29c n=1 Tax=Plagiogrammopsis vanheurckii TaxID=1234821 RepID=A0A2U9NNC4_9STRA|nr:ribosomal protein L29 [Plagiogrammopsis vanheurckii]AWT38617.1 ribosomal protein L29 [Plagiogrammopsis vanheurckii]